jgi:hypothetical protein
MRRKINIRRAGDKGLMTVAETPCPRYFRLSPNLRDDVAASRTSKAGHTSNIVSWP